MVTTMRKSGFFLALILITESFLFPETPVIKVYVTCRVNPHPPVVDGKLDDPAWEKAEWSGDFVQYEPYEGRAPTQPTAFKILYDDKYIYVAVRAYDDEPEKIVRRMSRRDSMDGDAVVVQIDSYHDKLTAFSFAVNAVGVKLDEVITNDGQQEDLDWNPIWDVETGVDSQGWTAEMRIPLSQLRFGNRQEQVWGLQVIRIFFRKQERSHWQLIPKNAAGWVHLFGELRGLDGLGPRRQIELTPYSVGRMQRFRRVNGNPYATGRRDDLLGGLDGKVGATSNLTLDFTLNPDFGQVEADPSVVNLTAYETFYEEKRPFFIEGRNILNYQIMGGDGDFSSDNLFYSRRIGRNPQGYPSLGTGEYADMPDSTSIIGAFKLTGKTPSGLSIGILDGITAAERAAVGIAGRERFEPVEPLTNYFSFRLQKDFSGGDTILGGMVTAVNRSTKNEELRFLHDSAYSGGLDFYHTWKQKTWFFSLKTVFSNVRGTPEAILRTQMSSVRYFQRPDADHIEIDPSRTSLSGHGGTLDFGKSGGGHLNFVAGLTWRSPGLELNDLGYLRSGDVIMEYFWAGYRVWKPFSIFREININFNQWRGWNFGGENTFDGGNINGYARFKNDWSLGFGINRQFGSLSASALRGGPSLRVPGGWNLWYNLQTDGRSKLRLNFGGGEYWGDNEFSRLRNIQAGVTYLPSNAVSVLVNPMYGVEHRTMQYVGTRAFGTEKRYLFGTIDQKTLGITFRVNWSLTPELSIQYYGQPFVSSGKYSEFKRITQPLAQSVTDRYHVFMGSELVFEAAANRFSADEDGDGRAEYDFTGPNFNFLQFRSNLVVRWEYTPGSAVYLVWSQGRTGFGWTGDFSFQDDIRSLFDVHPANVFLVKFSYCFRL